MNNSAENFDPADSKCWEQPDKYALAKEHHDGIDFYSIFILGERGLMMKVIDDFEYAVRLANKMAENGVKVFENFESLLEWYNRKIGSG